MALFALICALLLAQFYPLPAANPAWQAQQRLTDWALDYLGDWAVLCIDCAKTHRCVIVPIENQEA